MVLGFVAVSFGLSLPAAISAIVIGSGVGAIVMGVLSRMGGRLGVAQQIQLEGPGFLRKLHPRRYVNIFAGIGWAAVTVILGGQALKHSCRRYRTGWVPSSWWCCSSSLQCSATT